MDASAGAEVSTSLPSAAKSAANGLVAEGLRLSRVSSKSSADGAAVYIHGGFRTLKKRWLAIYEAEQGIQALVAAAGHAATVTTAPAAVSAAKPSATRGDSDAAQQSNNATAHQPNAIQLEDAGRQHSRRLAAAVTSRQVGGAVDRASSAAELCPGRSQSQPSNQSAADGHQGGRVLASTAGKSEAWQNRAKLSGCKRPAETPLESTPSQQRRGDDALLPPPGRLSKQASVGTLLPGSASQKAQPLAAKSILNQLHHGQRVINPRDAPQRLYKELSTTSAAASPPSERQSPTREQSLPRQQAGLPSEKPVMQPPVQRQRRTLQQPRGPDCAPHARPRVRSDAVPAAQQSTGSQPKAAYQDQKQSVIARSDDLPRESEQHHFTDPVEKLSVPGIVADASRIGHNVAKAEACEQNPAASAAVEYAQCTNLDKLRPQLSSNCLKTGSRMVDEPPGTQLVKPAVSGSHAQQQPNLVVNVHTKHSLHQAATAQLIAHDEAVRLPGSDDVIRRDGAAIRPPSGEQTARLLAADRSGSSAALARMKYLPAGALIPRQIGSVDLSSFGSRHQLLANFLSRLAITSDERRFRLVYQDSDGDWMLMHDGEDWHSVAAGAVSVMLTT